MTRPVWLPLLAFGLAMLLCAYLTAAHAAVRPTIELPRLSPERALESVLKPKPTCMKRAAIILYTQDEGGKWVPFGSVLGPMERCK